MFSKIYNFLQRHAFHIVIGIIVFCHLWIAFSFLIQDPAAGIGLAGLLFMDVFIVVPLLVLHLVIKLKHKK